MPIVEAVAIELGSAIAKSVLKCWMKDSTLGEDASSSFIDLLKSRTKDVLAQRRGQRQFETIGEKVGESLLPLFETEDARLNENSRIAVALAVADALNKLSSKILVDSNLEPSGLARSILNTYPAKGQYFNAAETELYERIIKASCPYIVDIASQLPAFTEHTFAEVLKQSDQILARTDQILDEVRRLRGLQNFLTDEGRFEMDYRLAVARNLDMLQLLGTDVSTANRRHRLSIAYITLLVQKSLPLTKNKGSSLDTQVADSSQEEIGRGSVPVDQAIVDSKHLLICGPAGSGKTTLLQWIAVKSASRSFDGYLSSWNDMLPFHIRLRHCVQSEFGLPRPEALPGLVASAIADMMPNGWVHQQLKSGRAIVLIDGLDEVSAVHREDVRVWLKALVETFPKSHFIITSRPHAVKEGWMNHEGFTLADLQPMQLSDIYSFIDHWHKAVREELYEYEEIAELESLAEHLKEDVKRNSSIHNLAANPLLCAMLCALNRDRKQQLPADRIELYEACCSLLLERRDKESRVELADYPILSYRQKRLLLEVLAYWMIINDWSEVALELVDEHFDRKLKNMPNTARDISGPNVRRLFIERSGIIREPVVGRIDFTHRTFQEFLAAKAASDDMDIGVLKANAHNDQWREVIILATGLATKQMREELIRGLISRGDIEREYRSQLHLLAVSCLETSIELEQKLKTEVEARLRQLIPPKDMTDAQALAAAGGLAVKHLAKGEYSAASTAACVRTLALIASEFALEMLKTYASDTHPIVIDELIRAWENFDKEIYAKVVLSRTLLNRTDLRLERLTSLVGIQYLPNLASLTIYDCPQLTNLSPLESLPQLIMITISHCSQLHDFLLRGLAQLSSLSVLNCFQLSTIDLKDLIQLISFTVTGCSQLETINLSELIQLTSLNLSGCTYLRSLDSLVGLTQLTSLNLSHCSRLNTIDLAGLTQLTALDLSYCSELSRSRLSGLTQLITLNMAHCLQFIDLSPLKDLSQLASLDLSHGELNDLGPLRSLTQLTSLDLSYCSKVSILDPIGSLTQLVSLNLSHLSHLHNLSFLANLVQLKSLDLSYCQLLGDLSPLRNLTQLTSLNLSGCSQLLNLDVLTDLTSLQELRSYGISSRVPKSVKKRVKII